MVLVLVSWLHSALHNEWCPWHSNCWLLFGFNVGCNASDDPAVLRIGMHRLYSTQPLFLLNFDYTSVVHDRLLVLVFSQIQCLFLLSTSNQDIVSSIGVTFLEILPI